MIKNMELNRKLMEDGLASIGKLNDTTNDSVNLTKRALTVEPSTSKHVEEDGHSYGGDDP